MLRLIPLLIGAAKSDVSRTIKRTKRNTVLYAIALTLFATTYVLTVTALTIYIAQTYGLLQATLSIAACLFTLAVIIIAVAMILNRRDYNKRKELGSTTKFALTASAAMLPSLMKSSGSGKFLGLGVVAFLAASALSKSSGDDRA